MKKLLTIVSVLMLTISLNAQFYNLPTPNTDSIPDMVVYDREGNLYNVNELRFALPSTGNPQLLTIPPTCNAGIFRLHFVDAGLNTGFDDPILGPQRQAIACQVFTDLSQLINEANSPYSSIPNLGNGNPFVEIEVRQSINTSLNPMLGMAGQYYLSTSPGIVHGTVWETINTGLDSWFGVNNSNLGNFGIYHGLMQINFGHPFYLGTNPSAIPSSDFDLYTVILHEALHALGIGSLINQNGTSKITNTNPGIYSIYDTYLTDNLTGNKLINTINCYNSQATILPLSKLTTPCSITFDGTATTFVSSDATWSNGTSLSHYPIGSCSNIGSYVMNPSLSPGVTRRFPDLEEVTTLCDIGYSTSGVYASTTYPSIGNCGTRVAGVNDYATYTNIAPGTNFQTAFNTSFNFSSSDILGNDENATFYDCLEVVNASGVLSGVLSGGIGNTITFTPNTGYSGIAILKYIPRASATGIKGNTTYIFILVSPPPLPPCTPNQCEMICYGGFEEFTSQLQYDLYTQGSFAAGATNSFAFYTPNSDNSPDFNQTSTNRTCGNGFISGITAHTGTNFVGLILRTDNLGNNLPEGPSLPLNSPLQPGETATISVWTKLSHQFCEGGIEIRFTNMQPCSNNVFLGNCPSLIQSVPIQSAPLANNTNWQQLTFTYTNVTGINLTHLLINSLPFQIYGANLGYVFIDDVSCIKNTPNISITKTAPSNACPNDVITYTIDVCNTSTFPANNVQITDVLSSGLTVVSGGSFTYPTQTIANLPAGGCQSFTLNAQVNVSAGTVNNTATVSSGGCLSNTTSNTATTSISQPTLNITQVVSNANPISGSTINLTVDVCNSTPNTVNNIIIETTVPSGNIILPGAGYTVAGNVISFNPFSLPSGTITTPSCLTFVIPITVACSGSGSICTSILSGGNICLSQNNCININVVSSAIITISPSSPQICSGQSTSLTASGANTYSWSPATGLSSTTGSVVTANPTTTTTYTVTGTDVNGCSSTSSVTVTVDPACNTNPDCTLPTTIPAIPNGATSITTPIPNNSVVEVLGLFTIDNSVTYTNVKFKMAAGARINILSGKILTLRKCHLFSCTQLWKEITVNPNANLVVQKYTIIEDAEQAIHWINGGAVTINSSIFNRNGVGVRLEGAATAPNVVVRNSIFTCRDFPASVYSISNPGSFNALKTDLFNNNLLLYPFGSLIAPAPANTRSLFGVRSDQVAATIGVTGTANNRNLFDYLDFGIQVTNANFTVINNSFANLSGFDGSTVATPGNIKGIGVFAKAKTGFNITIGGNNLLTRNQFNNCYRGANITNYSTINFINNTLTNTTTSLTFAPPTLNIGHFGLAIFSTVAGPSINLNYTINNNTIDNNATGIFINSVYSSINSQNIQLTGNNLNVTGSGTYCNQGIWMQSLAGSSVTSGGVNVTGNTVRNSEINALLFENVNNGLTINLNNELSVAFNANQSKQVIRLNNCSDAVITSNGNITTTNNTTIPTGTNPANFIAGIFLNNCQSSLVTCNTINYVGACVIFDLPNSNSQFSGNTMNRAQYGLVLANGAIIGQQGTPTQPSGNEWGANNPANITINHTYTLSTVGVNSNSPLFCKPNVITNCTTGGLKTFPCSNGSDISGNEYVIGSGLNTATGLPQATCTGKPGNPLANAKALLHEADSGNGNAVDKFLKKRQAFRLIKTDTTGTLMADNELSTFFNVEQTQNIGKLSTTNELVGNNNLLAAKNTNNSITPNNVADYNLKAVNEIWLQSMLDTAYLLTTADSSILYTIGNICIQQGGDATVSARSLLANFTQTALTFTDCFELPFGNGTNRLTDTTLTSNLILNGSIEIVDINAAAYAKVYPWSPPGSSGSPDIYSSEFVDLYGPDYGYNNARGHQLPQHGKTYAAARYFWNSPSTNPNSREPFTAKTSITLSSGVQYCLSYYISLSDTFNCGVNRSDAYFSPTPMDPMLSSPPYLLYVQPHVMADSTIFYTDKENWTKIEGSYTASGGENYITIGNLHQDNQTDTLCNGSMSSPYQDAKGAFYYMDNFSLEEIIPVNAGADVSIIGGDSIFIGNNLDSASSYSWLPNSYINDVTTLNPMVNPPVTTTYYVTKTQCSVVTTDSVTVFVNPLGVALSPLERVGVRIFPNPNNGSFTLTHNLKGENYVLEIVDLMGKVVHREILKTETQQEIKTPSLNKGIYFVNIKSETGELVYSSKMSVMK